MSALDDFMTKTEKSIYYIDNFFSRCVDIYVFEKKNIYIYVVYILSLKKFFVFIIYYTYNIINKILCAKFCREKII